MILPAAPPPGSYAVGTRTVYVGIDAEPPDQPSVEYYDTKTRRLGTLTLVSGDRYRTDGAPSMVFRLDHPTSATVERRFVLHNPGGPFGFSLWSAHSVRPTATIILIQGADDSTRDMGYLIPYFVAHDLNVVTYDQRGTGVSSGNWRYTSPQSKADDILAIIGRLNGDPAVDPDRIGIWGASNGGWVEPIVAKNYSVAFMILKSAPSQSIASNVLYEIEQVLREHGKFSPEQIAAAISFERTMLTSVASNSDWNAAGAALSSAKSEPWFPYVRIPPGMTIPPPAPILAALQASLMYDPSVTLAQLRVPTLALFGALDKNVDAADSAARYRELFKTAGNPDFTVRVFPNADHILVASATGYEEEPLLPVRYTGYPEAMIAWLQERGFAKSSRPVR